MIYHIESNRQIAPGVYRMALKGDTARISAPGQFAQVRVPGFYLPRPISVCDWSAEEMALVYKVVGDGTRAMSALRPGDALEALTGLGNGFDIAGAGEDALLVGGGLGVAPLYGLAKRLVRPTVILGFQSARDVLLKPEFEAAGARVIIATVDGSQGVKGFVTDALPPAEGSAVFVCGPEPMLKAVHRLCPAGQFSFEARMACGIGACMGCTCKTRFGAKRLCVDGPVMRGEAILW